MFRTWKFAVVCLALAGAAPAHAGLWHVKHSDQIAAQESNTWRPVSISIEVPRDLTVSEENALAPEADIVWRGELPGNRYAQVQRIFEDAAKRATAPMRGNRPVKIMIRVGHFHSVSERARAIAPSAVHNIMFAIQVFDARTGQKLTQVEVIQADLKAFTREKAVQAEVAGLTQRVRIVDHLAKVLASYMKQGPDQRHAFRSIGR